MVQSLSFAGVSALFVSFWAAAKSMGAEDPNAHLRRLIEFVKFKMNEMVDHACGDERTKAAMEKVFAEVTLSA